MANKQLFKSTRGAMLPRTDAVNAAGGVAYALPPKHALAQLAVTGCLNGTFYADAATQLDEVLATAAAVPAEFVAQTAIYARERGLMKDMPALLAAALANLAPELLPVVFDRVVDNARMLRNFVQVVRSGVTGRKSLGSRPKRLVQQWLARASDAALLNASVGNDPSLADIVKMVHPKAATRERAAFYGWLIGKPVDAALLPECVRAFEAFKLAARDGGAATDVPDVNFQLLTGMPVGVDVWRKIALNASWQTLRMNLNAFARHGVFEGEGSALAKPLARKLRDPDAIRRARALPWQLLVAHRMVDERVPNALKEALQDALEVALASVPALEEAIVLVDVSGSMASPVTGARKGATTAVSCVDAAALVASALLRANKETRVLAFDTKVHDPRLNPRDSLATNAKLLAAYGGGGTALAAPLVQLNAEGARGRTVIYLSDNQSWVDTQPKVGIPTQTMQEWAAFKARNPQAKLVCVDLQPYANAQVQDREDVLNVGGFSDAVFEVIARFARGELDPGHWVAQIERVSLN